MKVKQLFYLLILVLVFNSGCKGQGKTTLSIEPDLPKRQFTAEVSIDPYFVTSDSLSSNSGPTSITRNIIQDRNGDYWFASWQGIIHYDGKRYTNYTLMDSLREFHVFSAMEDSRGNLWFGTIGAGAYRYDGKTFVNITTSDGLIDDHIECVMEDSQGNIWFATEKGITRYDGVNFQSYTVEDGLTSNDVHSIVEDNNGNLWIGSREGTCVFDGEVFTPVKSVDGITFTNAWSIIVDRSGGVWISGNDGLWYFNGVNYSNLTTDFVGIVYEDKEGDILFNKQSVNPNLMSLNRYPSQYIGKPIDDVFIEKVDEFEGMIFGLCQSSEGYLWIGTLNGVIRHEEKEIR